MKIQTKAQSVHFNERESYSSDYNVTLDLSKEDCKDILTESWNYFIQEGESIVDCMALERVIDLIDLDDKEVIRKLSEKLKQATGKIEGIYGAK